MVLIADRFAVRGAIRHSYRGGVFRAVDQHTGEAVVLKQARRHALSSLIGTDACDLLRHEARMLDVLGPLGLARPRTSRIGSHGSSVFAYTPRVGTDLSSIPALTRILVRDRVQDRSSISHA